MVILVSDLADGGRYAIPDSPDPSVGLSPASSGVSRFRSRALTPTLAIWLEIRMKDKEKDRDTERALLRALLKAALIPTLAAAAALVMIWYAK